MPEASGTKRKMGFNGLGNSDNCFIRQFRWILEIENVCGGEDVGITILPPLKAQRPIISFRSMDDYHLTEMVSIPSRPEWRPINVTLWTTKTKGMNPVFKWLKTYYDAKKGTIKFYKDFQKSKVKLIMLDGCGQDIETWVYENVYPEQIDFGTLDMAHSDVVTCDLTLRYARAYIDDGSNDDSSSSPNARQFPSSAGR